VSGAILGLDEFLGFRGWQWVFLIEAAPAVILSFVVLRTMIDRPSFATWLKSDERQWLEKELDAERARVEGRSLIEALMDSRVIALSMIWFLLNTSGYGATFFMPLIVKGLGLSNLMSAFASAIPYLVGTVGLVIWGWSTDRSLERRWHLIAASLTFCVGLAAAGALGSSFWALAAMSVAVIGMYGTRPSFWPLPSTFLSGTAAAGGIALINSVGNLGGY
jgi:ACS family tartrate transporter-like MFS transporter